MVMNSKPSKPKLYFEVLLQFIAAVLYEVICDATHNTQWILRYHFYLLIKSINISVGVSFKLIAYNLFYLNKYYNGHIMISEWCVETVSSSNSMTIRRINLVGWNITLVFKKEFVCLHCSPLFYTTIYHCFTQFATQTRLNFESRF